ncbi:EAL domain-containing protein [Roseomonas sp. CAU 1739]|uniref:sensor domain-containing phosphodiesterase n=1 Tax=Roseomonas sp. CAU 1739 TaxID=3140364 RepID=UPI00325A5505
MQLPAPDEVAGKLAAAVVDGRITPVFQPILALRDRSLVGFEVLARWHDPALGIVSPGIFIPIAERAGLLNALTSRLMRQGFRAALAWPGEFVLAFNISPTQLLDAGLPDLIRGAAATSSFPLARVHVEITESAILADDAAALRMVQELRAMGVGLALDDFGTGHSSLTRLQALRFTKLKLDASFVRSMLDDRHSRNIVCAVVGLGQNLGLPVVAEGVETEAQARYLSRIGCDLAQGFLFGAGLPAKDVPATMSAIGRQSTLAALPRLSPQRCLAQMAALYRSSALSVAFLDPDLHLLGVSEGFARRLALPARAVIGRTIAELMPRIVPMIEDLHGDGHGTATRPAFEMDMPAGGTDLLTLQFVSDEADELLGYSITGIDITGRKQAALVLHGSE